MPSRRLNSLVVVIFIRKRGDRLDRRVIIVRRKRPGCMEAVRRAFPVYRLISLLFLGNTLWTLGRASAQYLARSLPKSRQNKKGRNRAIGSARSVVSGSFGGGILSL